MRLVLCVMLALALKLTVTASEGESCVDGSCGKHETYRFVNSADINADFLIKGDGKEFLVSLKPLTWCSVRVEAKVDKRVIERMQEPTGDQESFTIKFDRVPDENGIGVPIIYIDDSNEMHLLRLGKSSLAVLDGETNDVLDDVVVPASYMRNRAKKHVIYSEQELKKNDRTKD